MKSAFRYLFLFSFLAVTHSHAQDYIVDRFTTDEGLPSDYIYNSIQDDEGFMWISTEGGLYTFDGQHFQTPPYPELNTKEIVEIFKDKKGRIWLAELSGELYFIENGKVNSFDFPSSENGENFIQISEDYESNIWLSQRGSKSALCIDVNTLKIIHEEILYKEMLSYFWDSDYILNEQNSYQKGDTLYIRSGSEEFEFLKFNLHNVFSKNLNLGDGYEVFASSNRIYLYDSRKEAFSLLLEEYNAYFDRGVNNITKDKYNNLWVSLRSGFLRITNPLTKNATLKEYFNDSNSGHIYVDNQNNLWLSTLNQGIIKLNESNIVNIHDRNANNITKVKAHNGYLIYGTDRGEVVVLDEKHTEVKRYLVESNTATIYDLKVLDQTNILITTNSQLNILNLETLTLNPIRKKGYFKSASIGLDKNYIWVNGGHNNSLISTLDYKAQIIEPQIRSYSALPISNTETYIGTVNGLYKSDIKGTTKQISPQKIKEDIRVIVKDQDNSIWAGSHGSGIFIVEEDTLGFHFNSLPFKYVRDMIKDKNITWVASNSGICIITQIDLAFSCKVIDKSDGLAANQINSLCFSDGKIYAATTNGISILDKKFKVNNEVPILKINSIKINERDTIIASEFDLKANQRNIKIDYGGILFNNPKFLEYKYKLSGLNEDWIYTSQTTAQYPSLPAGKYEFLLQAKSLNSRWSELSKTTFFIPHHLTETLLFKLFLGLIFCTLLFLIFSSFSKRRQRSRQFKLNQMTALRAQMNPHFIFNSLNSVQDYVLRDDKIAANKYISRFSKLMRYILNASDKEFTNLKQELDALELYMSIESMRFDNELDYKIDISKNLETEKYFIPTMILQPYIENAINHGLKHSEGEKKLRLRIRKYKAGLVIEIEDNGVGRIKSRSLKLSSKNNYDSKGTLINQQRINLLNRHYQKENKVTFKDIYDENRNPTGTKVEIFLNSIKFS